MIIKIIFITGITNIVSIFLIFLSCRCMLGAKISATLLKYSWYKKLVAWHCYVWLLFFLSVVIHSTSAMYLIGILK